MSPSTRSDKGTLQYEHIKFTDMNQGTFLILFVLHLHPFPRPFFFPLKLAPSDVIVQDHPFSSCSKGGVSQQHGHSKPGQSVAWHPPP